MGVETLKTRPGGGEGDESDGRCGFHNLVVELTSRLTNDGRKNPDNRALKKYKSRALETLLTYPQELSSPSSSLASSSTSSSSSLSWSPALRERALTSLYSVAGVVSPEIQTTFEISDYHLVPLASNPDLFCKISDLVNRFVGYGEKDRSIANEAADGEDDVFSKTIIFLAAIARTASSSSPPVSFLQETEVKDDIRIENPQPGSQSFFCSHRLLQCEEDIFRVDPGVSLSGL